MWKIINTNVKFIILIIKKKSLSNFLFLIQSILEERSFEQRKRFINYLFIYTIDIGEVGIRIYRL